MVVDLSARLIFASFAVIILFGIINMVRKGLIKEKHSLLWIPLGMFFAVFCFFPSLLIWISEKIHLHYITIVVMCIILIYTFILLYLTVKLSQLREEVKNLAQEQALHRAFSDKTPRSS